MPKGVYIRTASHRNAMIGKRKKTFPLFVTCTGCDNTKPLDRFSIRLKRGYSYIRRRCLDCLAEDQRKRAILTKDVRREKYLLNTNGYRDKCKANYKRLRDKNKEKLKAIRATPEWKNRHKEYLKKWNPKNEARIRDIKRKYQLKIMVGLTDKYVIDKLRALGIENPPSEIIELKRIQLQGLRKVNQLKKSYNERNSNECA